MCARIQQVHTSPDSILLCIVCQLTGKSYFSVRSFNLIHRAPHMLSSTVSFTSSRGVRAVQLECAGTRNSIPIVTWRRDSGSIVKLDVSFNSKPNLKFIRDYGRFLLGSMILNSNLLPTYIGIVKAIKSLVSRATKPGDVARQHMNVQPAIDGVAPIDRRYGIKRFQAQSKNVFDESVFKLEFDRTPSGGLAGCLKRFSFFTTQWIQSTAPNQENPIFKTLWHSKHGNVKLPSNGFNSPSNVKIMVAFP